MAAENSIGTEILNDPAVKLTSASKINSALHREAHLETQSGKPLATSSDLGQIKKDPLLVEREQREQGKEVVQRSKEEKLRQFEPQEKETVVKLAEVKAAIDSSRNQVAGVEARLVELNQSWNIFRHLSSEKDGLSKWLERERDTLNIHSQRLAELELRQEGYNKAKEDFVAALAKAPQSNKEETNILIERAHLRLKQQSQSLSSLNSIDYLALESIKNRAKNEVALSPLQKFVKDTSDSFNATATGRFVSGVSTIMGKAAGGVTSAVSGCFNAATDGNIWSSIGKSFGSAWDFVTDGQKWKSGWRHICNACDAATDKDTWNKFGRGVSNVASKVWDFISDADTWRNLGSSISNVTGKAVDFLSDPQTWKNLGSNLAAACRNTAEFLSKPENWAKMGSAVLSCFECAGKMTLATVKFLGEALVNPSAAWAKFSSTIDSNCKAIARNLGIPEAWSGVKKVLGFVKDICDNIGITSIIVGAVNLVSMPFRLAYESIKALSSGISLLYKFTTGQISQEQFSKGLSHTFATLTSSVKEGLVQSARLVTGVWQLTMECTGIADMCRGVGCMIRGDKAGAAMYFGMGLANLVALGLTIGTAGLGVAVYAAVAAFKSSLRVVAQKGLTLVGKHLGEKIGKEFLEKAGMTLLKKQAFQVADKVVAQAALKGLSLDTIEELSQQVAKDHFKTFFKEAGLDDMIFKQVKDGLQDLISKPKNIRQLLVEMEGVVGKKEARKLVKQSRNLLLSGKTKDFDEVAKILTKEITDSIEKKVGPELKETFAKRFKASLAGEVDTPAAKLLATKVEKEALEKGVPKSELIDQYVSKASNGFAKGFRQALEEIAEAAIKKAIKRLKYPSDSVLSGAFDEIVKKEDKLERKLAAKTPKKELAKLDEGEFVEKAEDASGFHQRKLRETKKEVDGVLYTTTEELTDQGDWVVRGQSMQAIRAEQAVASKAIEQAAAPKELV